MSTQSNQTTQNTQNQTVQDQDDEENTIVFTDEFKDAVREYCEKDDQRMKVQKQLKGLRQTHKRVKRWINNENK